MRSWLYYRLSRDEDEELNSLTNQRKIIYDFAVSRGYEIVGESFDDNVSGMHFNREGIDKIYEVVEAGLIDVIVVKDLSRLGRHRTQTALFIDYLREHNVRVVSATENIDTFNENDDLIIGFKGLVNDFYARDGSRRVRTGFRQKQKEGIVMIPPFGYFKDKNTKTFRLTTPDEQFRHEGFVPAIISYEVWRQVQEIMAQRKESRARAAPGKRLLRYGGLLRCADCGRTFVGKRIKKESGERVQYVCDTYHRYGKEYCMSHVIREEILDKLIIDELKSTKILYEQNWAGLQKLIDSWIPRQTSVEAKLKSLSERINTLLPVRPPMIISAA